MWRKRKNVVFGEGNISSKIMIIGLGPGKEEDKQGRPFVGKAGKFLNDLLSYAGLKREEIYITNIVKCIPPNNMPTKEEIKTCTSLFLDKQIEIINPKIILCLGNIAKDYIFEKFGIENKPMNKVHGKVFRVKGKIIIPLHHPATALYRPDKKDILIQDWKNLKSQLMWWLK